MGVRGDLQSGRAALYGYLLATDASLSAFDPQWSYSGFGTPLQPAPRANFRLLDPEPAEAEPPVILRMHSWCAAFVDWCVLQLLLTSSVTSLTLSRRPKTASAFGLLTWGKHSGCEVFSNQAAPRRGDIAVFAFSHRGTTKKSGHTGIVSQIGTGGFHSVEGNTTSSGSGNQGYIVERRWRQQSQVKGFVRLPDKYQMGDFNVSSAVSRTA